MITRDFLVSKINIYSVIGSIFYGLICVSNPTPEVVAVIGHPIYFLTAALFYFGLYVIYALSGWKKFLTGIGIFLLGYMIVIIGGTILYMIVQQAPYEYASDVVIMRICRVIYYMWFIP